MLSSTVLPGTTSTPYIQCIIKGMLHGCAQAVGMDVYNAISAAHNFNFQQTLHSLKKKEKKSFNKNFTFQSAINKFNIAFKFHLKDFLCLQLSEC